MMPGRIDCKGEPTEKEITPGAVSKGSVLSRLANYPFLWIILLSLTLYFIHLGSPSLNDGEAMYAEIAREMRLGGDWITPRLNGTPHFDKPPLTYWAIGLSQSVLGETEFSARMWSALATVATILAAGALGHTLYGRRAGVLAAIVYAAGLGPYIFGRLVMPDVFLCLWITLAILGYRRGYDEDPRGKGPWPWVMFASLGLCALTKGLLGFGLPTAIIGLHILTRRHPGAFFSIRFAGGLCVTAAIAVPWHAAVARANPDFLGYYFIREHLERFMGRRYPADEFLPLAVFLALTFVWTFPWMPLVPQAFKRAVQRLRAEGRRRGEDLLPLIWIVFTVGLFSASHSRLEYYALPAMTGFSVIIAKLWDDLIRAETGGPSRRAAAAALGVMAGTMGVAAVTAFLVLGPLKELVFRLFVLSWPEAGWGGGPEQVALLEKIRVPSMAALAGAALFALGAFAAMKQSRPRAAFGLLVAMMVPFFAMVHWGFLVVEPYQSSKPIAEILDRSPPADVVVFQEPHEFMWVGGITYYTKRMVDILKDPRFEGAAAVRREPPERFLDPEALMKLWGSGRRTILVADDSRLQLVEALSHLRPVEILGRAGNLTVYATPPGDAVVSARSIAPIAVGRRHSKACPPRCLKAVKAGARAGFRVPTGSTPE